ncbi:hypothetical protein GPECTOR_1g507 [Gonium pectorale]|uniref:NADP-dependent oxidoreductase domain-containing protein n=1 Tax=Gonium pectorale TaxID=33097 RepID=A0A150H3G7_GONPE|nr:hypothetical protein GPECTOR_1g507 [Gonium pectorale]|eukprot:KXZ56565.1 hypothetical protein GPECTOR_1g507 [Gonium pectorale]
MFAADIRAQYMQYPQHAGSLPNGPEYEREISAAYDNLPADVQMQYEQRAARYNAELAGRQQLQQVQQQQQQGRQAQPPQPQQQVLKQATVAPTAQQQALQQLQQQQQAGLVPAAPAGGMLLGRRNGTSAGVMAAELPPKRHRPEYPGFVPGQYGTASGGGGSSGSGGGAAPGAGSAGRGPPPGASYSYPPLPPPHSQQQPHPYASNQGPHAQLPQQQQQQQLASGHGSFRTQYGVTTAAPPPSLPSISLTAPSPTEMGAAVEGTIDGMFNSGYLATVTVRGMSYRAVLFSPVLALASAGPPAPHRVSGGAVAAPPPGPPTAPPPLQHPSSHPHGGFNAGYHPHPHYAQSATQLPPHSLLPPGAEAAGAYSAANGSASGGGGAAAAPPSLLPPSPPSFPVSPAAPSSHQQQQQQPQVQLSAPSAPSGGSPFAQPPPQPLGAAGSNSAHRTSAFALVQQHTETSSPAAAATPPHAPATTAAPLPDVGGPSASTIAAAAARFMSELAAAAAVPSSYGSGQRTADGTYGRSPQVSAGVVARGGRWRSGGWRRRGPGGGGGGVQPSAAPRDSRMSGTGAVPPSAQIHDYTNLKQLSDEQKAELRALEQAEPGAGAADDAGYRIVDNQPSARLLSGFSIPLVGLGTWKSAKGEVGAAVATALRQGYRHIDCARIYQNEHEVGEALAAVLSEGVVRREEVFITSKLWNTDHEPSRVEAACRRTMEDLRVSYLDLYLMHWPVSGNSGPEVVPALEDTWAAMEALVRGTRGLVRTIGVSNFSIVKLERLLKKARIVPAVVQAHPYWRNDALRRWAADRGIHLTAYSPLGSPDSAAITKRDEATVRSPLKDEVVAQAAQALGKSPAQVLIRWAVQRGTSVLPKSVQPGRIRSNLDVFDWEIPADLYDKLCSLEYQHRMVDGGFFISPQGPYRTLQDLWDEHPGGAADAGAARAAMPLAAGPTPNAPGSSLPHLGSKI